LSEINAAVGRLRQEENNDDDANGNGFAGDSRPYKQFQSQRFSFEKRCPASASCAMRQWAEGAD
jgi:hypothetical protein